MKLYEMYLLVLIACQSCLCTFAQDNKAKPSVTIEGEVKKPLTLYADDLQKMKRTTVNVNDRNNKPHSFTGVALQDIFEMAGVTTSNQLRGENLSKYVLVKCADGYEVVFSLAELDSSFTDRIVILADQSDGKPLPEDTGPFKLAVPGEKKPARSGRQVVSFAIRFAKE